MIDLKIIKNYRNVNKWNKKISTKLKLGNLIKNIFINPKNE